MTRGGLADNEVAVGSSLYKTSPLAPSAVPLATGRVDGQDGREPAAWTNRTAQGGRVFYTSLGHPDDFELPFFRRLLRNGIFWAVAKP